MQNQYFKKDKKAMIYRAENYGEPGGMPKERYHPVAASPLWCYSQQLSQNDIFLAAQAGDTSKRRFVFNYRPDIQALDLIQYRNQWFKITRVDTKDDYNTDLFIYAENLLGFPSPDVNQIVPFDPNYVRI